MSTVVARVDEVLRRKLGIEGNVAVAVVSPPDGFAERIGLGRPEPIRPHIDVVVAFFETIAELEDAHRLLAEAVYPAGALFCCWPKKSSGTLSDLSDNAVRHVVTGRVLVDTKIVSIDDAWSALTFVWRKHVRSGAVPPPP